MTRTAALVGTVGGAGTTRLAVECGAALAADGKEVAVLDAALDTQGLRRHVPGDLSPEFAGVLTDETELEDALVDHPDSEELPGRLALAPVRAPFTRVAAAKTPAAGERMSDLLDATGFDFLLVDTPPIGTNPAVGAVTAADGAALVAPDTDRGRDGVARERGRLADIGAPEPLVVYNRADGEGKGAHRIPTFDGYGAGESAVAGGETPFAPAVASLAGELLETDIETESEGMLPF